MHVDDMRGQAALVNARAPDIRRVRPTKTPYRCLRTAAATARLRLIFARAVWETRLLSRPGGGE